MIDVLIYSGVAIFAYIANYFWLQKIYIESATQTNRSFLLNNITKPFLFLLMLATTIVYFLITKNDIINQASTIQIIIPFICLTFISIKPTKIVQLISCIIIAFCIPQSAASIYFPELNIYITKAIMIIFMLAFSFLYRSQTRLAGINFIELSAFGLTMFLLFLLKATPQSYGIIGLIIASLSFANYKFSKMPIKILPTTQDNSFFGVFVAWAILLMAAEYGLYPSLAIFSFFFINTVFQITKKIISKDFKKNFDIYYLSITDGQIDEQDLYSYTIKTYIVMMFISISSIKATDAKSVIIVAIVFGAWLLHKTYFLYQKKASWKNLYKDIKKDIKRKDDDTKA